MKQQSLEIKLIVRKNLLKLAKQFLQFMDQAVTPNVIFITSSTVHDYQDAIVDEFKNMQ